ncbi:hypothetical protein [Rhizobium favelukesii]|uniref:hypothetical protein n=1 Tax=Rhizobium favelukesii TaxID=348824 RepID=UPI000560BCCB|nr:hypothetical protein [Rhizobium favelukesii]
MIFCKIENAVVVDRIIADDLPSDWPDLSSWVQEDEAQIGWGYTGGAFIPPPAPVLPVDVPAEISRRQFFQVLANRQLISKGEALTAVTAGTLPAALDALVSQILDEDIEWEARMLFAGAQTFNRSNGFVDFFGAMQGMSTVDLDQLWRDASVLD